MSGTLGNQYDFSAGVTCLQVAVGFGRLIQRKHLVHRHLDLALGRELEQLDTRRIADGLTTVSPGQRRAAEFCGSGETDDRRDSGLVGDQLDRRVQRLVGSGEVQQAPGVIEFSDVRKSR